MTTHSCILARIIPWTELPSGLQSMGSQRVGQTQAEHAHLGIQEFCLFLFLFKDLKLCFAKIFCPKKEKNQGQEKTIANTSDHDQYVRTEKQTVTHALTCDHQLAITLVNFLKLFQKGKEQGKNTITLIFRNLPQINKSPLYRILERSFK